VRYMSLYDSNALSTKMEKVRLVYLVVTSLRWITISYGVVLLGYAIFGIVYYHNSASIVL
jgi:hypothetical protein